MIGFFPTEISKKADRPGAARLETLQQHAAGRHARGAVVVEGDAARDDERPQDGRSQRVVEARRKAWFQLRQVRRVQMLQRV